VVGFFAILWAKGQMLKWANHVQQNGIRWSQEYSLFRHCSAKRSTLFWSSRFGFTLVELLVVIRPFL
jgi:type II secretory pathway pseudopilin PulG